MKPLTFDQGQELIMFDLSASHVNLQGQQQGEGHLVFLVQTSHCILKHFKCHVLYNVGYTLLGDR